MVLDIKMCRFENVPWGFRLVGGSDFEFPLTVVKVRINLIFKLKMCKLKIMLIPKRDIHIASFFANIFI